jgi:hypothetical protein
MTTPVRPDQDEKIRTRLIHLKKQHRDLDNGITTAYKMHTEDLVVSKLKLKKLHLKEEIVRLEKELQD